MRILLPLASLVIACHVASSFSFHPHRIPKSLVSLRWRFIAPKTGLFALDEDGSYVPDGLTAKEYAKIKKTESDELKKMDLGAFGPRFKRTGRPDGDWFSMPSLWTAGFDANARQEAAIAPSFRPKASKFTRRYLPSFILAYLLLDIMVSAAALLKATQLTMRSAMLLVLRVDMWKLRHELKATFWITHAIKAVVATVCVVPIERFLEYANRRWLWAPKRTVVTSGLIAGASLSVWALLLVALKRHPGI